MPGYCARVANLSWSGSLIIQMPKTGLSIISDQ